MEINNLTTEQLIETYSDIINQLKERGVIRTKNLIGDLGEYLAIEHFNKLPIWWWNGGEKNSYGIKLF